GGSWSLAPAAARAAVRAGIVERATSASALRGGLLHIAVRHVRRAGFCRFCLNARDVSGGLAAGRGRHAAEDGGVALLLAVGHDHVMDALDVLIVVRARVTGTLAFELG